MKPLGNIVIHILRLLSVVTVFFVIATFTFNTTLVAKNQYTQALTELSLNDPKEGHTVKKFSFVSVANAVDIKPEYKVKSFAKITPKPEVIEEEVQEPKVVAKKRTDWSGKYKITGYNAVPAQTDDSPTIAAWNDNIEHAVNVAAVVQDSPWKRGTCLTISGLPEKYIVLDRFNARYNGQKKVDILVGTKAEAKAITGKRTVTVLPPGSCDLKRVIDGKVVYEKLQKKRF